MLAWLRARQAGGKVILRIEDLDHPRHRLELHLGDPHHQIGARGPEILLDDLKVWHAGQLGLDQREVGKVEMKPPLDRGLELHLVRCPQTARRRAAIGAHQPAAAQEHAAEPAGDDNKHIVERLPVDRRQDRLAGRAARLAIVGEAIGLSHPPSPAIVTGVGMSMPRQRHFHLVFTGDGQGGGEKAALLDDLFGRGGLDKLEHD